MRKRGNWKVERPSGGWGEVRRKVFLKRKSRWDNKKRCGFKWGKEFFSGWGGRLRSLQKNTKWGE